MTGEDTRVTAALRPEPKGYGEREAPGSVASATLKQSSSTRREHLNKIVKRPVAPLEQEPISVSSATTVSTTSSYHAKPVSRLVRRFEKRNYKARVNALGQPMALLTPDHTLPPNPGRTHAAVANNGRPLPQPAPLAPAPTARASSYSHARRPVKTALDDFAGVPLPKKIKSRQVRNKPVVDDQPAARNYKIETPLQPDGKKLAKDEPALEVKRKTHRKQESKPTQSPQPVATRKSTLPLQPTTRHQTQRWSTPALPQVAKPRKTTSVDDTISSASSNSLNKQEGTRKGTKKGLFSRLRQARLDGDDENQSPDLVTAEELGLEAPSNNRGGVWGQESAGPLVGKQVVAGPITVVSAEEEEADAIEEPIIVQGIPTSSNSSSGSIASMKSNQSSSVKRGLKSKQSVTAGSVASTSSTRDVQSKRSNECSRASSKKVLPDKLSTSNHDTSATPLGPLDNLDDISSVGEIEMKERYTPVEERESVVDSSRSSAPKIFPGARTRGSSTKYLHNEDISRLQTGKAGTRMLRSSSKSEVSQLSMQASRGSMSTRMPPSLGSQPTMSLAELKSLRSATSLDGVTNENGVETVLETKYAAGTLQNREDSSSVRISEAAEDQDWDERYDPLAAASKKPKATFSSPQKGLSNILKKVNGRLPSPKRAKTEREVQDVASTPSITKRQSPIVVETVLSNSAVESVRTGASTEIAEINAGVPSELSTSSSKGESTTSATSLLPVAPESRVGTVSLSDAGKSKLLNEIIQELQGELDPAKIEVLQGLLRQVENGECSQTTSGQSKRQILHSDSNGSSGIFQGLGGRATPDIEVSKSSEAQTQRRRVRTPTPIAAISSAASAGHTQIGDFYSDDKKEVRFSSERPRVHKIPQRFPKQSDWIQGGSDIDQSTIGKVATTASKKPKKRGGGLFSFMRRRRRPADDAILSLKGNSTMKPAIAIDEPPQKQPTQKQHSRVERRQRQAMEQTPLSTSAHKAPPTVHLGPNHPDIRENPSDIVKSPAALRRQARGRKIQYASDILAPSVDSEVPIVGSGASTMESTTGSSMPMTASLASGETSYQHDTRDDLSADGGDFLSWLLPSIFGPVPTPKPAPISTGESKEKGSYISDEKWKDILSATEILAIQYREAQKMGDEDLSISEQTIREVNSAIARFKGHSRQLGISDRQLMEAIRDDIRSVSKIISRTSRRLSSKDKFIDMYEYYFAATGPGSSLGSVSNTAQGKRRAN